MTFNPQTDKDLVEWFCNNLVEIILRRLKTSIRNLAQYISFDRRNIERFLKAVKDHNYTSSQSCYAYKMGHLLNYQHIVIILHKPGCDDSYWTWTFNLYDPLDAHILELLYPNRFDARTHRPKLCTETEDADILTKIESGETERKHIRITPESWNQQLQSFSQLGISALPQPDTVIAGLVLVMQMIESLGLEVTLRYPTPLQQPNPLPLSTEEIQADTAIVVGTYNRTEQRCNVLKFPYFYYIRYNEQDQLTNNQLAMNPRFLLFYDKRDGKEKYYLYEVELDSPRYTHNDIHRIFGYRTKHTNLQYRVFRIKAESKMLRLNQSVSVTQIARPNNAPYITTAQQLVSQGIAQFTNTSQRNVAEGETKG